MNQKGVTLSPPLLKSPPSLLHPSELLLGHSDAASPELIPEARPFKNFDLVWLCSGCEADLWWPPG